ncbi:hypothetical protein C7T36_13920 [Rhodococcus sp. AD45-ID]|uniref:hypothetical protein n=1 Tax=Rhodococcus TaxID=1827 RepID=UPI0005D355BB|nr:MULTISPECIES: hypothetical protein [Rhodococcus]KJF24934.1 hypothetical protein SZ00_01860 [Rhodococcus sp. AD45]PSR43161.1 hypothetical protein C7T36_13920 [Rhodococcus sp. AD45-ID]QXW00624.1 hypothetical protein KYT97_19750 [Rhodococcus globerulus]
MSGSSDWAVSGWWIGRELGRGGRAEATLTRNDLIELWVKASASPKPNIRHFAEDLTTWTHELGATEWVETMTTPEVARRMRQGVNEVATGVEIWDMVSMIAAEYADPFARCSANVVRDVRAERPRGLSTAMVDSIRPLEENHPRTAARNAMIATEQCGTVTSTRDHADRFVETPQSFTSEIVAAAMRGYSGKLVDYLDRIADDDGNEDLEILSSAIEDMTIRYGEPDVADRSPSAEEIEFVERTLESYLNRRIVDTGDLDRPLIQGSNLYTSSDVVGETWRRARRNMLKLHIAEIELTDDLVTRVYKSNRHRATQDLRRKLFRSADRTAHAQHPESYGLEHTELALGYRGALMRLLFARARTYVMDSSIESSHPWGEKYEGPLPCWEREVVLGILQSDAETVVDGSVPEVAAFIDRGAVRPMVRHLLEVHRPTNTLAPSPTKSVALVMQLLQGALAMAINDDDIFAGDGIELVGKKAAGQTWTQKSAEIIRRLRTHRDEWTELTETNK